jgi:ABC-type oligopeptide transport system ATPase subunit
MNQGAIVERGNADAIYAAPQNEYTQKLLNAIPRGYTGHSASPSQHAIRAT